MVVGWLSYTELVERNLIGVDPDNRRNLRRDGGAMNRTRRTTSTDSGLLAECEAGPTQCPGQWAKDGLRHIDNGGRNGSLRFGFSRPPGSVRSGRGLLFGSDGRFGRFALDGRWRDGSQDRVGVDRDGFEPSRYGRDGPGRVCRGGSAAGGPGRGERGGAPRAGEVVGRGGVAGGGGRFERAVEPDGQFGRRNRRGVRGTPRGSGRGRIPEHRSVTGRSPGPRERTCQGERT